MRDNDVRVQAISSSQVEISQLRNSVSSLKEKLDAEQRKSEDKMQKVIAGEIWNKFSNQPWGIFKELEQAEIDKSALNSKSRNFTRNSRISLKGTRKINFLYEKEAIEQKVRSKSHQNQLKNNVSELRDKLESASNEKMEEVQKAVAKTNSENDNENNLHSQEKVEDGQIKTQDLVQMQNLSTLE